MLPVEAAYTVLVLAVVLLARNILVYHIRRRRLAEIAFVTEAEFDKQTFVPPFMRRYEQFDEVSYHAMLFDLRRWTFKQFYPTPVK